jgi:dihydroorotase
MYPAAARVATSQAVCRGLADGTIDTIATDHAPHHRDEKGVQFDEAAKGIVGSGDALPLRSRSCAKAC